MNTVFYSNRRNSNRVQIFANPKISFILKFSRALNFMSPAKGSHMNIICGNRGCVENCSKNIKVMETFYSIDSAVRGYNAYSDSEVELDYSR